MRKPWPSIARTVYGDHKRFLDTYMNPYPGYYFTGDGAGRDHDGYYWIRGRVDDVINVSGHRLSTAEIESALIQHNGVAETAVVGIADELTGQAVVAYVSLKPEFAAENPDEPALLKELVLQVRKTIGPFAAPRAIHLVTDLPKVRLCALSLPLCLVLHPPDSPSHSDSERQDPPPPVAQDSKWRGGPTRRSLYPRRARHHRRDRT